MRGAGDATAGRALRAGATFVGGRLRGGFGHGLHAGLPGSAEALASAVFEGASGWLSGRVGAAGSA